MKNFINYYYNLNIHDLCFRNGKYYFNTNENKYMLEICKNPNLINYYVELSLQTKKYSFFFEIISNIQNNYLTFIDSKPYVLLKLNNFNNDKISIFDIKPNLYININDKISILNRYSWVRLWEDKIDYFEELFYNKQDSYKNIYPLFNYFIGIAENALLYLKETERNIKKEVTDQLVISHERIGYDTSLYDYYDPTNLIIDHPSRDIGEYIKSMFINNMWDIEVISAYLKKYKFSKYSLSIMYSRILFPSFFFDYMERLISNNKEDSLLFIETHIDNYQNFIREISILLEREYNINVIPWIKSK